MQLLKAYTCEVLLSFIFYNFIRGYLLKQPWLIMPITAFNVPYLNNPNKTVGRLKSPANQRQRSRADLQHRQRNKHQTVGPLSATHSHPITLAVNLLQPLSKEAPTAIQLNNARPLRWE